MKHYTFVDYATQAYQLVVSLLILCFHNGTVDGWQFRLAGHLAAVVAVHWFIQWFARGRRGGFLAFLRHFYPVLFYTWFFNETGHLNRMFLTEFLDPVIIKWEQALFGCQPSVLFMEKLPYLLVSEVLYAAYFSYYLMITGVGVALYIRNRRAFAHYISVVSFVFYVCYLIYIFVPVIGPRLFFRSIEGYSLPPELRQLATSSTYPGVLVEGFFYDIMAWIYQVFESPGAAMPSSHVAIATCTLYFSFRYLRRIRHAHLLMVVLLCLSTFYCRYHYLVDVFGGLLTVAVLLPLANRLYFKFENHGQSLECGPPPSGKPAALQEEARS